jgi:hypothetical protein
MKPTLNALPADMAEMLKPLIRAAKLSCTLPSKFWMDQYLKATYRLYRRWKRQKIAAKEARRVARWCEARITHGTHPIRVLIAATCPTGDGKIQSRWTRALEYAVYKKIRPSKLTQFIRNNGGLSGCATAMSQLKPKRKPIREWV